MDTPSLRLLEPHLLSYLLSPDPEAGYASPQPPGKAPPWGVPPLLPSLPAF
jgi:hypothetical protein